MSGLKERLLKYSEYGMDNSHNIIASVLGYYGETCQDLAGNESLINECAKVIEDTLQPQLTQAQARVDIFTDAMAEIKATDDGNSFQSISYIVQGCIDEIKALEQS